MHAAGKGRGRQVIAVARTADVILMMLDAGKGDVQRRLLEKELESVGIRLNKKPPNIYFKVHTSPYPCVNDNARGESRDQLTSSLEKVVTRICYTRVHLSILEGCKCSTP